jgi:hypothetical protein
MNGKNVHAFFVDVVMFYKSSLRITACIGNMYVHVDPWKLGQNVNDEYDIG